MPGKYHSIRDVIFDPLFSFKYSFVLLKEWLLGVEQFHLSTQVAQRGTVGAVVLQAHRSKFEVSHSHTAATVCFH